MPRGVRNSTTAGTGTDTSTTTKHRQQRKTGLNANRKNITTGLIQANQVSGLSNINDPAVQRFADALVMGCNMAIAGDAWGKLQPLDFVNAVVGGYLQTQHRT